MSQYHTKQKTNVKRLTKEIEKNKGIASKETFEDEKEFQDFLVQWLEGKTLYREGNRSETKETRTWSKKEQSQITNVEIEPDKGSDGFGDIAIHHELLNLSYDHILASPFILELKNEDSFRYATAQAIRYKDDSSLKYQEKGQYKILNTGIATPKSLSTAEIASSHGSPHKYAVNFEAKRIYWKLGIGVLQSANPDELILSFNEHDMVMIK